MQILRPSVLAAALVASAALSAHSQQLAPPEWAWAKKIADVPGSQGGSQVNVVRLDAAGNLYLLGLFSAPATFDGTPAAHSGANDIFLAKYSAAGTLQWLRLVQTPGNDTPSDLAVSPAGVCTIIGNYGGGTGSSLLLANSQVLTGTTAASTTGRSFIMRFDGQGGLEWGAVLSPTGETSPGAKLAVDAQGNSYWSGNFTGDITVAGQPAQSTTGTSYLAKFSPTGQAQWLRATVGQSGPLFYTSQTQSVLTDDAGSVYWYYHNRNGQNVSSGWDKLSPTNKLIWHKTGFTSSSQYNSQVAVPTLFDARTKQLIVVGSTRNTAPYLPCANLQPAASAAAFLARVDTSGACLGGRMLAYDPGQENGPSLAAVVPDAQDGFTAFGAVGTHCGVVGTQDLGCYTQPTQLHSERFLLHYSSSTNQFDWTQVYTGLATAAGSLVQNAQGDYYLAGYFSADAMFGATSLNSPQSTRGFLAKLTAGTVLAAAAAQPKPFAVYPQPTRQQVTVMGLPTLASIRLLDVRGREVRFFAPTAAATRQLDLSQLSNGLYFLRITDADGNSRAPQKLIIAN